MAWFLVVSHACIMHDMQVHTFHVQYLGFTCTGCACYFAVHLSNPVACQSADILINTAVFLMDSIFFQTRGSTKLVTYFKESTNCPLNNNTSKLYSCETDSYRCNQWMLSRFLEWTLILLLLFLEMCIFCMLPPLFGQVSLLVYWYPFTIFLEGEISMALKPSQNSSFIFKIQVLLLNVMFMI